MQIHVVIIVIVSLLLYKIIMTTGESFAVLESVLYD